MDGHLACSQEANIINLVKTQDRMERTLERLVIALEKQIDQGARIVALEDNHTNMHGDMAKLSDRLREVELKQAGNDPATKLEINEAVTEAVGEMEDKVDSIKEFVDLLKSKPAILFAGVLLIATLIGTVCDLKYHMDTVKAVYSAIK